MARPQSLFEVVESEGDFRLALDEFMDEFYMAHGDPFAQQAMIDPEPPLTGDAFIDSYIAAVADHLARRWDLDIPSWQDARPERMGFDDPVFDPDFPRCHGIFLIESPYAFRRRNIFTNREPLQRARWPRDVPVVEQLTP